MNRLLQKHIQYSLIIASLIASSQILQARELSANNIENWYTSVDITKIDAKLTGRDQMLGFTLGYQHSPLISFEATNRKLLNSPLTGELNTASVLWRSHTKGFYYKLGAGFTFSSGDIFDDTSASFSMGAGFQFNQNWSIELDANRISDDVNAISLSTQLRF